MSSHLLQLVRGTPRERERERCHVLCPLTSVTFTPYPGQTLILWIPRTAWVPVPERTVQHFYRRSAVLGLAVRGWGRRKRITKGRLAFWAAPLRVLAAGCFPPSLFHKSSRSSHVGTVWILVLKVRRGVTRSNPGTCDCDLFWKTVLADDTELGISR